MIYPFKWLKLRKFNVQVLWFVFFFHQLCLFLSWLIMLIIFSYGLQIQKATFIQFRVDLSSTAVTWPLWTLATKWTFTRRWFWALKLGKFITVFFYCNKILLNFEDFCTKNMRWWSKSHLSLCSKCQWIVKKEFLCHLLYFAILAFIFQSDSIILLLLNLILAECFDIDNWVPISFFLINVIKTLDILSSMWFPRQPKIDLRWHWVDG